jgi:hypothetical protein
VDKIRLALFLPMSSLWQSVWTGSEWACSALQQIASSSETFFNQPGPGGEPATIYIEVAAGISGARLIAAGLQ